MWSLLKGRCWKGPLWFCAGIVVGTAIAYTVFCLRNDLALVSQPRVSPADKTLIKAIILFRHGDRHVEATYPTDPYRFEQFWPDGRGALTKEGKQHMHQLGRNLRARYSHFLHEMYLQEEVVMESTNVPRCLMSAQLVLAGLYSPIGPQVWSSELPWQPIPVYTNKTKKLNIGEILDCPKIINSFLQGKEVKQLEVKNKQLLLYVAKNFHVNATFSHQFVTFYEYLLIQSQMGVQLPKWMVPIREEYMQFLLSALYFIADTQDKQRLMSGLFFGDVVKFFTDIQSKMKARLYSVQDIFLQVIYQVLTARVVRKVYFGSTILIELHSANAFDGEHLEVKENAICEALMDGTTIALPDFVNLWMTSNYTWEDMHPVDIPQCGRPCYLETFLKMLLPLIPDNWEEECLDEVTSERPYCVTIPNTTNAGGLVANLSAPSL